jgi:hypothetical protein
VGIGVPCYRHGLGRRLVINLLNFNPIRAIQNLCDDTKMLDERGRAAA